MRLIQQNNNTPFKRKRVTLGSQQAKEENLGYVTPKREENGDEFTKVPPKAPKKKRTPSIIDSKNVQFQFVPDEAFDEMFKFSFEAERLRGIIKYNFDVAKDEPVEGKFKWVPLK